MLRICFVVCRNFNKKVAPHKDIEKTKPAQEVIFSRKKDETAHPTISFNDIPLGKPSHQKHLGIYLDEKPNFKMHIETALCKVDKRISIIKKLRHTLRRKL